VKPGDVYRAEDYVAKAAAEDKDFSGPEVPKGMVVKIEHLTVIDWTTANKTLRLGFRRAGKIYWLKRAAAGASGYSLTLETPLFLVHGEAPYGRVESATANDELYFLAQGAYM